MGDDGWKDELVLSYQGPDTSGRFQVAQPRQFSEAEWTLAEEGLDCTKACRAVGKKCNEWAVRKVRTAADIRRVASLASYTCTFTTGWAYRNNPGVCTNSKCCLDGSCTGACAYVTLGAPAVGPLRGTGRGSAPATHIESPIHAFSRLLWHWPIGGYQQNATTGSAQYSACSMATPAV